MKTTTPLIMTVPDALKTVSEGVSAPRPSSGATNQVVTQTRKIVNSTVTLDYRDICKQLEATIDKAQALIRAKNDLELMARLSNITLNPDNNG